MAAGGGHATFTAECSHTFHFNCISASVAHGHLVCPLCNARWRELPFLRPTAPVPMHAVQSPNESIASPPMHSGMPPFAAQVPPPTNMHILQHHQPPPPVHTMQHHQPPPVPTVAFDDDEQVEPASGERPDSTLAAASTGAVVVNTHAEYPAVARASSSDRFAVLVHVKAPGMADTMADGSDKPQPRAPLDLVTVLDVSDNMSRDTLRARRRQTGRSGARSRSATQAVASGSAAPSSPAASATSTTRCVSRDTLRARRRQSAHSGSAAAARSAAPTAAISRTISAAAPAAVAAIAPPRVRTPREGREGEAEGGGGMPISNVNVAQ